MRPLLKWLPQSISHTPALSREKNGTAQLMSSEGVALFGILLMNIVWFAHGVGWEEFTHGDGAVGPNFWAWVLENTFFEGTQRALFSLLFGAGVIILTSRAEKAGIGIKVADIYYRRNLWLIAFGMIDGYLLLWEGDILYFYGLAALFLFLCAM